MSKYIEFEPLREDILNDVECDSDIINYFLGVVDSQPFEDVESVVYCKDCKHLYCCSAVDRRFFCRHHLGLKGCLNPIDEKPFCSYGERKEGTEE